MTKKEKVDYFKKISKKYTNTQLSKYFGIAPNTVSDWKSRGFPDKQLDAVQNLEFNGLDSAAPVKPKKKAVAKAHIQIKEVDLKEDSGFLVIFSKDTSILKDILSNIRI